MDEALTNEFGDIINRQIMTRQVSVMASSCLRVQNCRMAMHTQRRLDHD